MISSILFLLLLLQVESVCGQSSFSIGVPLAPLNAKLQGENAIIAAMVQAISLPTTCCYDDVGHSHVHLNLQNIAVKKGSAVAKSQLTSSTAGLTVHINASAETDLFYRLCVHDDPFGHGCSTLSGCKGDVFVITEGNTVALVRFKADANGQLAIASQKDTVSLSVTKSNMCSSVLNEAEKALTTMDTQAQTYMETFISSYFAEYSKLNQTIAGNSVFDMQWKLAGDQATTTNGLVLLGDLDVTSKVKGKGPFKPSKALPDLASHLTAGSNNFFFAVSDSVLTNIAWSYFVSEPASKLTTNITFGSSQDLALTITQSPQVHFTDSDPIVIAVSGKLTFDNGTSFFTGTFDLSLTAAIKTTNPSPFTAILQLTYKTCTAAVTTASGPHITNQVVESAIGTFVTQSLPFVNLMLDSETFSLPAVKGATIGTPSFKFGDGYMLGQASITFQASKREIQVPADTLPCPTISGAHQDGCI